MRQILGHRFLGVVFIALLAFAVWLVYAIFAQKFTSFDKVTLSTDSIGLQLPQRADVKIRGVIIGEVLDRRADGRGGATLTLGIHPSQISQVPQDVTASILPKTLFGEKYVALDIPKGQPLGSTASLQAGDHIGQTKMPLEVEKVLRDFYPLLRTIQPAELDYTLNAVANALDGRGEQIGRSIVTLDSYLKRLNPQIPALVADLKLLAKDSGVYADVVPQLAQTLRNTVKTGHTLIDKQTALHQFLRDVRGLSDTTTGFLRANGDNIIQLGKVSAPTVRLLARYSPEYDCLLKGIVGQIPMLADTFRGFIFHISVELLPKQPRGYNTKGYNDKPVYGDHRPPTCAGLPNPPGSQAVPYGSKGSPIKIPNFRDGVDDNGGTLGRGDNQRPATGFGRLPVVAGTPAQRHLIAALTAPALGVPADRVPGTTSLLFAPVAAGTEVSTR